MNPFKSTLNAIATGTLLVSLVLSGLGCGVIIDKDNIKIAKIDDKYITRGDLGRLIYNMPDDKRPRIRTRNDLLRILEQYIDEQVKIPLGKQLHSEGLINIPRELGRELYFKSAGDNEQVERGMWNMEVPPAGQETELMRVYGLTADSLRIRREIIEIETDRIIEQMQGDAAVEYLAARDYRAGELQPDPDLLQREYDFRKEEFVKLETMAFRGLSLPVAMPNSFELIEGVRAQTENGEDFDEILDEYFKRDPNSVGESFIENNPENEKFRGFWLEASGREVGEIVGPVFMPPNQRQRPGGGTPIEVPETWLLFKVIEHTPETIQTLEEATAQLVRPLIVAAKMRQLREEHGVAIFKDKLADPKGFGDALTGN
jgi:hypothetical protein